VTPREPLKIDYVFAGYEKNPEFEVLGGLVFTELTLNHIQTGKHIATKLLDEYDFDFSTITKYEKVENRQKSRVIISWIIPDSAVSNARCFKTVAPGAPIPLDFIVKKVNERDVFSIQDFRTAASTPKDDKYLVIETEGGQLIVREIKSLIEEDEAIRRRGEPYDRSCVLDNLDAWVK
jgi:hypothetical protein